MKSVQRLRVPVLMVLGVAVVFIAVSPYLVMLLTALKPSDELFLSPATIVPQQWEWSNFIDVWTVAPIATYLRNSLLVTVCATAIVLVAAVPAAYYVARHRFRGRTPFLLFVLLTQMIAPTAVLIGIYRQFRLVDMIDNWFALILVNAAFNMAFAVWILVGFFSSIPEELEEAARLDGATRFGVLRRIVLPLAGPGMVTAAIFTFVAVWNEYVLALTLISSDEKKPLSVGITGFIGQYDVQYQYLFATAVIGIVPVVIMFALIEKKLAGGLTAGAVK
ncbi:Inner membrane ABC transporter permease protein YcjP [Microbacterium oxydans]|nr:Inner membrane ABC transporter permease protein YcjP [Microbacterium oxydans]